MTDDVKFQRDYYRHTAANYDAAHLGGAEHMIALSAPSGLIVEFNPSSILDVVGWKRAGSRISSKTFSDLSGGGH